MNIENGVAGLRRDLHIFYSRSKKSGTVEFFLIRFYCELIKYIDCSEETMALMFPGYSSVVHPACEHVKIDVIPSFHAATAKHHKLEPKQQSAVRGIAAIVSSIMVRYHVKYSTPLCKSSAELSFPQDLILKPVRVATSKPARQTYLNTLLFMITSAILLGLAVTAYILFYINYVPQIGIERIIHLQYGYRSLSLTCNSNPDFIICSDGPHPYGIASLDSALVGDQAYDIALSLHVPRSPPNLATGNFMLSLSLLSPSYTPPVRSIIPPTILQESHSSTITLSHVLLVSRRPAILTYTSRLVSLSSRLFSLPLYILGLKHESEVLNMPMAESAVFKKGRTNVPAHVLLELQTGQEVQVYDVRIQFKARFSGLRWLMYNHRIMSFFTFTTAFWFAEILFAGLGWMTLRYTFASSPKTKTGGSSKDEVTDGAVKGEIKEEPETDEPDLSDTPRTFPTYGRQQPLRYVPKVKDEDSEELILDETAIQPLPAMEADDEDEEGLIRTRDSGIGTSFSEGGERSGVTRRRSGRGS